MRKIEHRHRRRGRAGGDDDGRCRQRAGSARGYRAHGRRRGRDPARQRRAVRRGWQRDGRGRPGEPADRSVLAQVADGGRGELRQRGLHPRQPTVRALPDPGRLHGPVRRDGARGGLGRIVAQVGGLHRRLGRLRPRLRGGHRVRVHDRHRAEHPAPVLPPHRRHQRGRVPAAGQRPPGFDAGVGGRQRPRGHRPGERRPGEDLRHAGGLGRARCARPASRSRSPARPGTPSTTRAGCPGSTAPPASRPSSAATRPTSSARPTGTTGTTSARA